MCLLVRACNDGYADKGYNDDEYRNKLADSSPTALTACKAAAELQAVPADS